MPLTIFLADGHEVVRSGLVSLLERQADFRVVGAATDGQQAVREILTLSPDVVVMDVSMPTMSGIEEVLELRARQSQTKVIILSMHASVEHVFRALEAGANGYLLKDAAAKDIVDAVRTVHGGRRYLSPRVTEIMADAVQRSGVRSPLETLSRRERQVLPLVTEGRSSAQIAELLSLSPKSVDTYRRRLMQKLHLSDVAALVKFAIQHGLTSLE